MSRPATFTQPRPQPVRSKSGPAPAPAPTGAPKRAPVPLPRSTSGPSAVNYWSLIIIFFSHLFRNYSGKREERDTAVRFSRVSYYTLFFLSRSPRKGWDKCFFYRIHFRELLYS